MQLSKDIWKWAVAGNQGAAWIFFILATCEWLPTNFRLHKHDGQNIFCDLCQSGSIDDIKHAFSCPATCQEQNNLKWNVEKIMKKWNIPYYNLIPHHKDSWISYLQPKLTEQGFTITKGKLQQLITDYLKAESRQKKDLNHLHRHIQIVLRRTSCSCTSSHSCHLKYSWLTPPSLVRILKSELSLEVDGMADVLHHSTHLHTWFSKLSSDCVFGAKWNFFKQTLAGKNVFICPPFEVTLNGKNLIRKDYDRA